VLPFREKRRNNVIFLGEGCGLSTACILKVWWLSLSTNSWLIATSRGLDSEEKVLRLEVRKMKRPALSEVLERQSNPRLSCQPAPGRSRAESSFI
jgi:hypothetical protein